MSKRRRCDDAGDPRSQRRRHHLYLVVGDWTNGYSMHKVDMADLNGDPGADLDSQATGLPDPPVFRLECPLNYSADFAAVGSRIIAMNYNDEEEGDPVLLYDTATGGLAVGPRTPIQVREGSMLVPAFDRLYVLGSTSLYEADDHFEVLAADEKGGWAWKWNAVPVAPFNFRQVACQAAHPDGHTVFFSVHQHGTYSFDTETHEWRRHGGWLLPFRGHAYYDGEVDAWVGLHRESIDEGSVCSCDVVSAGDREGAAPPAWKLAKEKMVCETLQEIGDMPTSVVRLTRMGRGKFCLVEHRSPPKGVHEDYLLYVTKFKLRYDKDGGLRATARRARSYTIRNSHDWWVFGI